jgi:hypothetical protein
MSWCRFLSAPAIVIEWEPFKVADSFPVHQEHTQDNNEKCQQREDERGFARVLHAGQGRKIV